MGLTLEFKPLSNDLLFAANRQQPFGSEQVMPQVTIKATKEAAKQPQPQQKDITGTMLIVLCIVFLSIIFKK